MVLWNILHDSSERKTKAFRNTSFDYKINDPPLGLANALLTLAQGPIHEKPNSSVPGPF